jgi:hypothetical protein
MDEKKVPLLSQLSLDDSPISPSQYFTLYKRVCDEEPDDDDTKALVSKVQWPTEDAPLLSINSSVDVWHYGYNTDFEHPFSEYNICIEVANKKIQKATINLTRKPGFFIRFDVGSALWHAETPSSHLTAVSSTTAVTSFYADKLKSEKRDMVDERSFITLCCLSRYIEFITRTSLLI